MPLIVMEYITSPFGIIANLIIVIIFCGLAYDKYAKRWGATTGKYRTKGTITWSEHGAFVTNSNPGPEALISYAFTAEGKLYNGTIFTGIFGKRLVKQYPRGKEVTIFYAPRDPSFSRAERPPSQSALIGDAVSHYLIFPLAVINIPLLFIYWLIGIVP